MAKRSGENGGLPFDVELPENSEHLNMIIYGDTGAGKTHLCGTAMNYEATSPALFVDFEGGTKTLHGMKIDVTRPKNWKDIQAIYEYFLYDNNRYRSVIIDPLTEAQKKHSMGTILGEVNDDGNVSRYADLERAIAPTRQDWLRSGEQMRKLIRAFRELAYLDERERRVHVIMTALERYDEKKQTVCPQLPGALGLECGAMVDILVRLSRQHVDVEDPETGETKLITKRHLLTDDYVDELETKYLAKNRGNRLGLHMWEPTIEKLLSVWSSQKGGTAKDE